MVISAFRGVWTCREVAAAYYLVEYPIMDPDAILRFNNILEEVTKQEEFSLDTPVNEACMS